MRILFPAVFFAVFTAAAAAQAGSHRPPLPPPIVSHSHVPLASPLTLTFGPRSVSFTPAQFAALPHSTLTFYNGHTKADEVYSGVPLVDLLARIDVPTDPRGRQLLLYLVAEGADGYKVVYSLAEVIPTIHDATVFVADTEDGKTIPVAEGPFKLVDSREVRPARWVHNLIALRVQSAN